MTTGSTDPTVLRLAQVSGRDGMGARGRPRGRLDRVTVQLPRGMHGFVGAPEDGTAALCELAAGLRKPRSGVLTVRGRQPWRDAVLRRSIASLLPAPALPLGTRVEALARRLEARVPFADLGLGAVATRPVARLSFEESRAVELALALYHPAPLLLVLFEPEVAIGPLDRGAVRHRLGALVEAGATVVIASADATSLRDFCPHVHLLERGRLAGGGAAFPSWPRATANDLAVWLAPARYPAFAAALEGVVIRSWRADQGRMVVGADGGEGDLGAVARAVAAAAVRSGVMIRALRAEGVDVPGLSAAVHRERRAAAPPAGPTVGRTSSVGADHGS
ncbi:MAG: hypothetical protein AAGN82_21060 [Myxococcota bacterium]